MWFNSQHTVGQQIQCTQTNSLSWSLCQVSVSCIVLLLERCNRLQCQPMQFQTIHFSSRTDSGVHALANSAHVTITRRHRKTGVPVEEAYECSAIQASMNHRLRQQEYYCRVTHVCCALHSSDLECRCLALLCTIDMHLVLLDARASTVGPLNIVAVGTQLLDLLAVFVGDLGTGIYTVYILRLNKYSDLPVSRYR